MFNVFFIFSCLCLSFSSFSKPFVIVTDPNPPYEYEKDGKALGMDVEILNHVGGKVGLEFKYSFVPWARALEMVKTGKADAIISLLKTEERQAFLLFPESPIYEDKILFFAKTSYRGNPQTLSQIKGQIVGVVDGNSYGQAFDDNTEIVKEVVSDQLLGMKKLIGNRTALFVINEIVGWHLVQELQAKDIKTLPIILSKDKYYIGISKKSFRRAILFERLSKGLREAERKGDLRRIREKYLKK